MKVLTGALFSLSVGFGCLAGLIRWKHLDQAFYPFVILLFVGLLNETASLILMYKGYSNVVNYNVFVLAEGLLICTQFFKWRLIDQRFLKVVFLSFIFTWLVEALARDKDVFYSYSIIYYSLAIVVLSIGMINGIVFKEPNGFHTDSRFLICSSFIVYFIFSALTEAFWLLGLFYSKEFRLGMQELLTYINLLSNVIYVFAIIWIPAKLRFIRRLS